MKNLRLLFWLCVLGAGIYVGWMMVPAFINNYRFEESIDDSARTAAVNSQKSEDEIRSALYLDAKDLEIPVKPEDIRIERSGGDVFISAEYTVHVDLPMHPVDLQFHPSSKRGNFKFR